MGSTSQRLTDEFELPFNLLDDSALKVSFATDTETVPTLLMTDDQGQTESEQIGFVRDEWQALVGNMLNQLRVVNVLWTGRHCPSGGLVAAHCRLIPSMQIDMLGISE